MTASRPSSASERFRQALADESPLQLVGVINAYCGLLAERAGFRALYLSGAGISNTLGVPDLGIIGIRDVITEVQRITAATDLPLLVDGDTGWGSSLAIRRGIKELVQAGAAGVHLEDQIDTKRCGHRDGKSLVSVAEMGARISAATEARGGHEFFVMARTDAYGVEGLEPAIARAQEYVVAGADAIFAEAMSSLDDYRAFTENVQVPVLANMTEFGKTPLFHRNDLASVGVAMILYPLSAFRAMNEAASQVFRTIREDGSQVAVVDQMQTREELYDVLRYYEQEQVIDEEQGANS